MIINVYPTELKDKRTGDMRKTIKLLPVDGNTPADHFSEYERILADYHNTRLNEIANSTADTVDPIIELQGLNMRYTNSLLNLYAKGCWLFQATPDGDFRYYLSAWAAPFSFISLLISLYRKPRETIRVIRKARLKLFTKWHLYGSIGWIFSRTGLTFIGLFTLVATRVINTYGGQIMPLVITAIFCLLIVL